MQLDDFWSSQSKRNIEERIAALLNGDIEWRDVAGRVVSRAQLIAAFSGDFSEFENNHGLEFQEAMRSLVSTWIATGRNSNGIDAPWDRTYPSERIQTFWSRNSPYVYQAEDGRIHINFGSRHNPDSPSEWAQNLAESYFVRLLDSPRRECLSNCMKCGKYFVRVRQPKRGIPTRNGSFCLEHRDERKSRNIKDTRKIRKERLIELASRLAIQYAQQNPREAAQGWIARYMNREMLKNQRRYHWAAPVTPKWVTQNARAIREVIQAQ